MIAGFKASLGPRVAVAAVFVIWAVVIVSVTAFSPLAGEQSPPPGVLFKPVAAPVQTQSPPAKAPTQSPAAASSQEYAGEAMCLTCHEDQKKGYHSTPHGRAENPRTPMANQGCESCHGPGKAHSESGDPEQIKRLSQARPSEVTETCTTCHNRTEHVAWMGSKHESRSMSCTTCHSVHSPKSETKQLKARTERETCAQCHQRESNKIARSSHMPVQEGKMGCSTCHNPHGSDNVRMLREGHSITEACTTCHAEKRGPFLFEHAVGRENCVTCHDPHGSNNDRLLVAKQPMLCQRCHIATRHPSTIYDQTQVNNRNNRIVGRGCVNCHSMVHGSNHPTSGKFFLR
jgi:DmsE family decaheme c-type cytochrome